MADRTRSDINSSIECHDWLRENFHSPQQVWSTLNPGGILYKDRRLRGELTHFIQWNPARHRSIRALLLDALTLRYSPALAYNAETELFMTINHFLQECGITIVTVADVVRNREMLTGIPGPVLGKRHVAIDDEEEEEEEDMTKRTSMLSVPPLEAAVTTCDEVSEACAATQLPDPPAE